MLSPVNSRGRGTGEFVLWSFLFCLVKGDFLLLLLLYALSEEFCIIQASLEKEKKSVSFFFLIDSLLPPAHAVWACPFCLGLELFWAGKREFFSILKYRTDPNPRKLICEFTDLKTG